MAELHCRLPRLFVEDREDRGLECARHGPFKGNIAICWPDLDTAKDMLSDARYQHDGTDAEGLESLRRSAKRAAEVLAEVIAEHQGRA
jgi:hypothetical protein